MGETVTVAPETAVAPVEATLVPVAPVEASAAAPAAVEAPAAAVEAPTTIIGDALAPPPAETPVEPVAPDAPNAEGQSVDPAPPQAFEPFTLPEGVTLPADRVGEFTSLLTEFRDTTKAPHAEVQAFGQKLIERHVAEVQRAVADVRKAEAQAQAQRVEAERMQWKEAFLKDPDIGGNRFQTTVDAAREFIRTHGGTEEQQAEFRKVMDLSGVGNHPAVIRLLAAAGRAMSEGRPLAARPTPPPLSRTQKLYGKTG